MKPTFGRLDEAAFGDSLKEKLVQESLSLFKHATFGNSLAGENLKSPEILFPRFEEEKK
jgi:hypothetical protein